MKSTLLALLLLLSISAFSQNALLFDGVDDYVQCPNPGPTGNSSRTVEAWVKIPNLITIQTVILDWGDMLTGGRFTLNIINGKPRIEVGGNGFSSTTTISTGVWHHIAATFDNTATSKLKLFVDGAQVAGGNPSVTAFTNTTNGILIGKRNDNTGYFAGYIDEVRVWNIAKTQTQIAADMNASFCLPYTGIVASFNFNQGAAGGLNTSLTTLNNQASASNNGTLHGFGLSGSTSNWVIGQTLSGLNATTTQAGGTLSALPAGASSYQWINCSAGNTVIVGANAVTYTPTSSGSYAAIVSKNGCVDTAVCVNMTVGIAESVASTEVDFFPNPFSDFVRIQFHKNALEPISVLRVYNFFGKLISENEINTKESFMLNTSEWDSGIYFIELSSKDNIYRKKLIKR